MITLPVARRPRRSTFPVWPHSWGTLGGPAGRTRSSPVAQLAEHATVNRRVSGSSPLGGAPFGLWSASLLPGALFYGLVPTGRASFRHPKRSRSMPWADHCSRSARTARFCSSRSRVARSRPGPNPLPAVGRGVLSAAARRPGGRGGRRCAQPALLGSGADRPAGPPVPAGRPGVGGCHRRRRRRWPARRARRAWAAVEIASPGARGSRLRHSGRAADGAASAGLGAAHSAIADDVRGVGLGRQRADGLPGWTPPEGAAAGPPQPRGLGRLQLLLASVTVLRREPAAGRWAVAAQGLYEVIRSSLTRLPVGPARRVPVTDGTR
jgi:hypothetical protein